MNQNYIVSLLAVIVLSLLAYVGVEAVGLEVLFGIVLPFIIFWIAGSLILWIAGRIVSGPENAKFTDALWISLLGAILDTALTWVFENFVLPALPRLASLR